MAQATGDFDPNAVVNYENEARAQGWKPQEEWVGDPERWVDAETFVTRAQNWSGHLKKEVEQLRKLMREQAALNKKNQEQVIAQAKQREAALQQHIQNLEAQRAAAISQFKGEEAVALERTIRDASTELEEVKKQTIPQVDPTAAQVAADWRSEHAWYGTDDDLTKECDFIGNSFGQMHPDYPLEEILDFVDKEMSRRHPELKGKITKPAGPQGSDTGSGVRNVTQGAGDDLPKWADLDEDTRKVADQLIARKVYKNRKEYLESAAIDPNIPITEIFKKGK